MICPICQSEMTVMSQDVSSITGKKKQYDKVVYFCLKDDVWITIETPKKET